MKLSILSMRNERKKHHTMCTETNRNVESEWFATYCTFFALCCSVKQAKGLESRMIGCQSSFQAWSIFVGESAWKEKRGKKN